MTDMKHELHVTDEERRAYTRLAEGCEALIKLHGAGVRELARYLMQYTTIRETK